ncbi:deoxynucleoside kinase [Spiroplasma endosymbiont of Aspidapion aeneum]|uniref:deoxynucleoside kinase n=1 Tax=Spiroplasma endosymbiont of Aspidapion aeneum TaxID=3066276 RepID=UPI00313EC32B
MRIALFGTVGAGKSTVSEEISKRLGHEIFPEPIDDNPYFDDYYRDMKNFSFKMQIYMLLARSKQLTMAKDMENIIFDRTILEDTIFIDALHQLGNLNDIDHKVLIDFFDNVILPSLGTRARFDVVIYLKLSTKKAVERVISRGRAQELPTDYKFWDNLNMLYDKAYNQRKNKFNFLVIDAETDDLDKKVDEIIEALKKQGLK